MKGCQWVTALLDSAFEFKGSEGRKHKVVEQATATMNV